MAVLKPRERLVYFRITEDEFHQFASVCEQEGARSISDLARSAVQRLIADCNRQREAETLMPRMKSLEKLIAEVTSQLHLLAGLRAQNGIASEDANGAVNGHASATPLSERQNEGEN